MNTVWNFVVLHRSKLTLLGYWLFTTAVHTMPTPALSHGFYAWLYPFMHALAGGLLAGAGVK